MVPQRTSIMPDNLAETIGQEGLRDLVAFLLAQPKPDAAAAPVAPQAPPPRKRAEVERAIRAVPPAQGDAARRPLKLLLVWSKQDHGPGEHDYPAWAKKWQPLLAKAEGVEVATSENWPSDNGWAKSDVVVLYCWNHQWSAERFKQLDAFQARGGGIVALHAGIISDDDPEALAQRLGLAAQPVRTKYRHGATTLTLLHPQDDALTRGLERAEFIDETYWPLIGDRTKVTVLATAVEEQREWPMLWKFERGKGRVVGCVLGHYAWTFDDPLFRLVVLRGIAWAGHSPEGRLQELATAGVTLAD
jgi:type 1 glutamine amidotransferase